MRMRMLYRGGLKRRQPRKGPAVSIKRFEIEVAGHGWFEASPAEIDGLLLTSGDYVHDLPRLRGLVSEVTGVEDYSDVVTAFELFVILADAGVGAIPLRKAEAVQS